MSIRKWMRLMSVQDVAAAKLLAESRTEPEIVAMAKACVQKGNLIKLWFLGSCFVPIAVLVAPVLWPSIMLSNFLLWLAAMIAAMCLPIPARIAAERVNKEGRIIALAFWLRRNPNLLRGRR